MDLPLVKQWLLTLAALALVGVPMVAVPCVLILVPNVRVLRGARPYIQPLEELPSCQVAIVLGAGLRPDGTPSATLEDRLEAGLDLYRAGRVRKLLLSGDHGQRSYDEVNAMRRYVLDAGVPEQDVFLDHAGFRTFDTLYRARDVFQIERCIVVTQRFHLPRSVYTARTLGLEAWGHAADRRRYAHARRNAAREVLARTRAWLDLHVRRARPRFLGPAIPISGDGRATWDERP
ncbi:MAG: SanA/YdcF family protein [bacterium]